MIRSGSREFMIGKEGMTIIYNIFTLSWKNIPPVFTCRYDSSLRIYIVIASFIEIIDFFTFPVYFKIFTSNTYQYPIEFILRFSSVYGIENTYIFGSEFEYFPDRMYIIFHPVFLSKFFQKFYIKSIWNHFYIINTRKALYNNAVRFARISFVWISIQDAPVSNKVYIGNITFNNFFPSCLHIFCFLWAVNVHSLKYIKNKNASSHLKTFTNRILFIRKLWYWLINIFIYSDFIL